ncbi:Release factor glutamine methyltransferase [Cardinium endosymbiont cEper1 of Encarsia pergandiella]|uniref:peptide chain release factor N(5)-glutamine methyltransferase n=1 Tax=Cardinium endosymbiont of Encarsia pergandiella TaxID=249402 RepID=UPI00027EA4A9|nr:peptide chain release factor N(5)-glutamine methyltransferase [Cardinium endosymbiont of Encarsia pergandiella]CCM10279.1 Release factor glutamine methyltransferase [Cardinium endosymbiont cEper1 of Encarsia pergandiella]
MNQLSNTPSSVVEMPLLTLSDLFCQSLALAIPNQLECRAIVQQLLNYYLQVDLTDYILNPLCTISPPVQKNLLDGLSRLKKYEPIQYVIGTTYFVGNLFKVTPAVLIPRPETEEWVTCLMRHLSPPASILDIGTGSGCIAITLKKQFPTALVDALDISKEALAVAAYNAAQLGVDVHFIKADILTDPLPSCNWSLIVSNPPYVSIQEKAFMHPNVLDYEPHLALFVDDDDPLLFYRQIIQCAVRHLCLNGILCLEINEALGEKIVDLLCCANFKEISLYKDIRQKDRWIMAVLNDKPNI